MSKSTKIITSVVAIALVIAAMVVGIYAATAGGATISASVSWRATAGLELTLMGTANNGSTNKTAGAYNITTSTSNTDANNIVTAGDNLNIDFVDLNDEDGVNDTNPITFTYEITNNSTTVPLIVKMSKAPKNENNVAVTSATAKLASDTATDVYAALTGAETSVTVPVGGDKLTITITIDTVSADASVESYDAGVVFSFAK